ncbi:DUF6157 family protein [Bowmanella dokdonensis]|uniref:Uncharacterized protein n=1 Tax=Bowmanella dokdonensis TaxID=751969 RepID=A0A939DRD0_9ALTE|nr:DUF6157 family protein [Bowmanella dokdonensis]MBN7827258.1 hypothetical protein [Bowmanella dokdonensis]
MYTTNYANTFIAVAPDSTASVGTKPPEKSKRTIASWMFTLLYNHPYKYTSDDLIFEVFAARTDIPKQRLGTARTAYFSKPKACLRTSDLTKKYGWGIHADEQSRIALYAVESKEYEDFVSGRRTDSTGKPVSTTFAMRSKR